MSPLITIVVVVVIGWVTIFTVAGAAIAFAALWERSLDLDLEYVLLTPSGPMALVPVPDEWEGTLEDIFELREASPWAW